MKISQLPEELRKLALDNQKNETDLHSYQKDSDSLMAAFYWEGTAEGHDFWHEWHHRPQPPTEDLKINTMTVSLLKNDEFLFDTDGMASISKEEAKRLIEFLQAQI